MPTLPVFLHPSTCITKSNKLQLPSGLESKALLMTVRLGLGIWPTRLINNLTNLEMGTSQEGVWSFRTRGLEKKVGNPKYRNPGWEWKEGCIGDSPSTPYPKPPFQCDFLVKLKV